MENKSNTKYIVMLVIFTVLFFVSMVVCIFGYRSVAKEFHYSSISGRVDRMELDEKMFGPDHIYSTLYFDKDYEEEFDNYWEFAQAYRMYIKGRYADDPTEEVNFLRGYMSKCSNDRRKQEVQGYIDIILSEK